MFIRVLESLRYHWLGKNVASVVEVQGVPGLGGHRLTPVGFHFGY